MKKTTIKRAVYGYLRGSNGTIDLNNQMKKIIDFGGHGDLKDNFISDVVSSRSPLQERGISRLIEDCERGDKIIVAELSRLARNTEETLAIVRLCREKGIELKILDPDVDFTNELSSEIVITVLGLVGQMERHFISQRTRQSLKTRRDLIAKNGFFISKEGKKIYSIGAKKGVPQKLKLDKDRDMVLKYINLGLNKTAIAKLLRVNRVSVTSFLKRHPIKDGAYIDNSRGLS
jgi:DNA invertase Pin-like site-specific DNA recombinase